jgi:lipopolysaccharide biosynthesis glycosyltransferase
MYANPYNYGTNLKFRAVKQRRTWSAVYFCLIISALLGLRSLVNPQLESSLATKLPQDSKYVGLTVHVVITADGPYIMPAIVLINSTLSHSSASVHFHILVGSERAASEAKETVQRYLPSILADFVVYDSGLLDFVPRVWNGYRSSSLEEAIVYARYFLAEIFPDLDRVIYLDVDTLVTIDISHIFAMDLMGYPLAGTPLCRPTAQFRNQVNMSRDEVQHFSPTECSLNVGVLVCDLEKWREHKYSRELASWTRINLKSKLYGLGAQPPFNFVFYRRYLRTPDFVNLMDLAGLKDKNGLPITAERNLIQKPAILHWNGVCKPWTCNAAYAEIWRKYASEELQSHFSYSAIGSPGCGNRVLTGVSHIDTSSQFTVIICVFRRLDIYETILEYVLTSNFVLEVLLVWNEDMAPCPETDQWSGRVRCISMPENFVDNRFKVWREIRTEAVLHHDDDIFISKDQFEPAFRLWLENKDQLLGFEPRRIHCSAADDCVYRFQLIRGEYHIVIGKLFFVHRRFMELYSRNEALLELNRDNPCEDISMNFLVGNLTRLPHIFFKANITAIESTLHSGLSTLQHTFVWRKRRSECINRLRKIFPDNPIVPGKEHIVGYLSKENMYFVRSIMKNDSWCSDKAGGRICKQP